MFGLLSSEPSKINFTGGDPDLLESKEYQVKAKQIVYFSMPGESFE